MNIAQGICLNRAKWPSPATYYFEKEKQAERKLFEHAGLRLALKFDLGQSGLGKNVQEQLADLLYFRSWQYGLDGVQNTIILWPQEDWPQQETSGWHLEC